jgi:Co/Zn/Cd efflux system component
MFIVELVASRVGDSMSLQADTLDFLGDAVNYGISFTVVGMALTVRARAAQFKSLSMALIGLWAIGSRLYRVVSGSEPAAVIMGEIALLALLVNVVLLHCCIAIGKETAICVQSGCVVVMMRSAT